MIASIEELEQMDASEIHAKRLNAKEVLTPKNGEMFTIPTAEMEQSKSLGGRTASQNIHLNLGASRTRRRTRNSSMKTR